MCKYNADVAKQRLYIYRIYTKYVIRKGNYPRQWSGIKRTVPRPQTPYCSPCCQFTQGFQRLNCSQNVCSAKHKTRVNPLIRWLDKDAPKIVSGQAYLDFALADLLPHFNDEKRGHAGIFSQMRLDAGIYSHIYYWVDETRRICASSKENSKKINILDNLKGNKKGKGGQLQIGGGSVYNVRLGLTTFNKCGKIVIYVVFDFHL